MGCPQVFERDRAWSLPISGPTIAAVSFDPILSSLEVLYNDGSMILLANVNMVATGQITTTPNWENTVLGLIAGAQKIGMPTNQEPPSIQGMIAPGAWLFADVGGWCYCPSSYLFQWYANGAAVPGQTGQWYQVGVEPDLGIEGGGIITTQSGIPLGIESAPVSTVSVSVIAVNQYGSSAPYLATLNAQ